MTQWHLFTDLCWSNIGLGTLLLYEKHHLNIPVMVGYRKLPQPAKEDYVGTIQYKYLGNSN